MIREKEENTFLLVGRVQVDASVEEGAVDISDHGTDVASCVGRWFVELEFVDGSLHVLVPGNVVTVVDRVDGLGFCWDLELKSGEDELTDRGIQSEALHSETVPHHELRGASVAAVAGTDHLKKGERKRKREVTSLPGRRMSSTVAGPSDF
jgi:hypothetical protein